MTSHANCIHPATKAARAACRKASAKAAAEVPAYTYLDPMDDKDLDHAKKGDLAENSFYRRFMSSSDADWEWYSICESYLENARLSDSAFWVADLTARQLTNAATEYTLGELGPCPEVAAHPMEDY